MKWYVVNALVGSEEKIKKLLIQTIERSGMKDCFGDIYIPAERIIDQKNGKKKEVSKKIFPGYIMIEMEYTQEAWNLVRSVKGVGAFVGPKGRPTPLSEEEVRKMKEDSEERRNVLKPKIVYSTGEKVRITDGPFASFTGLVDNVMAEKLKLRVMVMIFGRQTPVELDYTQVEKAD